MTAPVATFDEILSIFPHFTTSCDASIKTAQYHNDDLLHTSGDLGVFENIIPWIAGVQRTYPISITQPRLSIFAGNHGCAKHNISIHSPSMTQTHVDRVKAGVSAINQICKSNDMEMRLYELHLDIPTADITTQSAMTEQSCCNAMAYGMTTIEQGIDMVCLADIGTGNTTAAAAVCYALFDGSAKHWTGNGSGVTGDAYIRKIQCVEKAVSLHKAHTSDPLLVLQHLGGYEISAMVGAIIAARLAGVPVILDGFVSTAAAAILFQISPEYISHCRAGHLSNEKGHKMLLDIMGLSPIVNLSISHGQGVGAALAFNIIKTAVLCHTHMGRFSELKASPSE